MDALIKSRQSDFLMPGRAALEAEIAQRHIVPPHLHSREVTKANFIRAADLELATTTYRRHGMPQYAAASFDRTLLSGVRLIVHIDQQDRLLSCWTASEADNDAVPQVHIDERHCSPDFLAKCSPYSSSALH